MREDWRLTNLGACVAEIQSGRSVNSSDEPASGSELGVLKTSCVYNGRFDIRENKAIVPNEQALAKCPVTAGTIIVSRMNTADLVGASGYVNSDYPNIFLPDRLWAVIPKRDIDPRWLFYVISSPEVRARLSESASGTSASMKNISQRVFLSMPTRVPTLREQQKISEILRTWDEMIETLVSLRASKLQRLDGISATLIHDETTDRLQLRKFLQKASARNHGQKVKRVLSVTNSLGFVLAEDQFAHRVASADLSNYRIVRRGQYAYNPSRINVGSIARLDAWENGALSPMYVVFQVQEGLDSDFFGHWLRSVEARKRIALAAQGSVRNTVSFGDLGSILIPVPTIERQQSISHTLNAGRHEIALLDTEIQALTRQKRGLMQKLLSGEWRVNQESPVV